MRTLAINSRSARYFSWPAFTRLFMGCSILLFSFMLGNQALAAQHGLKNFSEPLAPGQHILLPNGQKARLVELLPDGNLQTDAGVLVSPAGIILSGPHKGESASPESNAQANPVMEANPTININLNTPVAPGVAPVPPHLPAGQPETRQNPEQGSQRAQAGAGAEAHANPASPTVMEVLPPGAGFGAQPGNAAKEENGQKPALPAWRNTRTSPQAPAGSGASQAQSPDPQQLTPGSLLPMTPIIARQEPPSKAPGQASNRPARTKSGAQPTPHQPGQPLDIPEDAAKTGNLSFLSGCWEGTRPEYNSKRPVRECFCFGKDGIHGTRRINDFQKHRICTGKATATMNKNGVLGISSGKPHCSDGANWSEAEMVCRKTGQKSPCTWVFEGNPSHTQSYEIPFLRLEQCTP